MPAGMTAPQAAGVIHTDFEKGFIRAEVCAHIPVCMFMHACAREGHYYLSRPFVRARSLPPPPSSRSSQVIAYKDLDHLGSEKRVKEAGLLKSEGKEYVMQEGDVVLFRFN